ncbi:MAG: hypothetical protein MRY77_14510 [Rhodobacteraceae bacterium]|nr:hypothetical protein [Paracoccaceae bacterium]
MLTDLHSHLTVVLPSDDFSGVEVAEDIDVLREIAGTVDDATVIVMPWGERGLPNERATGGFLQSVEVQFATGIVQRDFSDRAGAERATRMDTLKSGLEAALAGWTIPGFDTPCELIGGETSPISTGVSIYVQTWATTRFLRGE